MAHWNWAEYVRLMDWRRLVGWKKFVQTQLRSHGDSLAGINQRLHEVHEELRTLQEDMRVLRGERLEDSRALETLARERKLNFAARSQHLDRILTDQAGSPVQAGDVLLLARRPDAVLVFKSTVEETVSLGLGSLRPADVVEHLVSTTGTPVLWLERSDDGWTTRSFDGFSDALGLAPGVVTDWLETFQPAREADPDTLRRATGAPEDDLGLIDFFAHGRAGGPFLSREPFDHPGQLPPYVPAEPKRRSVLFLHNNYYHYNCLADALKKRSWDAVTVSIVRPDDPQQQFFHGEDVNLWDEDPNVRRSRTRAFFQTVPERFGTLHFYGRAAASFFPENYGIGLDVEAQPWDFLELRRHRTQIGYFPSGCIDGAAQSSIRNQTNGLCRRCVWELDPSVCCDRNNLAWNEKILRLCDWIGLEGDHLTPERSGPKFVADPVTACLDPERWAPGIRVPDDMLIERDPDEILIYHGVGNYTSRRRDGRDIKGTGAVFDAIERLKAEGRPVRLIFAHDIPSTAVRFLQVQADIVVDQLNYGRYGANAREAMMLGKPVLTRLLPFQAGGREPLRALRASPLVDASEATVIDVLRDLVDDPQKRRKIGWKSRDFAVAWHGQDACADRFERLTDAIRAGLAPASLDLWPALPEAGHP